MGVYIIKRLLLMVPTFGAISLMVFVLLNFAPGTPGANLNMGEAGSQDASQAGEQRESYRLFKEQFNLDKPILFNARFSLTRDDVQATLEDVLNVGGNVSISRRIEAQEEIENWGRYAVPALVEILLDESAEQDLRDQLADISRQVSDLGESATLAQDLDARRAILESQLGVRALASQRLTFNAQRQNKNVYISDPTPEQRQEIKTIVAENLRVSGRSYRLNSDPEEKEQTIAFWAQWHEENRSVWEYSTADKVGVFFFDTRFAKYWGNLIRLDFGISHVDKRPVFGKILSKLKYSVTLSICTLFLIYSLSLPIGIWSAVKQNSLADRIVTVILFVLYSLPSFFTAVILLNFFTMGSPFQWFPTSGFESIDTRHMTTIDYIKDVMWHIILPISCMTYGGLASLSRYARTGLLDVIRSDYVRTARAKGLPESIVILKHAARNGMIPILTLLASLLPALIGGSVIIEVVFGIPGMGSYLFDSINVRDYNSVMGVMLIASGLTLVGMLLSDLSYALVDPRITFE